MDESELLRQELARERRARKQAEQLLEQKSLELYQRNEELQHKAELLARSNTELEQFAYIVSHDLQAPLRTIAGFSQLLTKRCRDRLDADGLEFLGYIDGGAKHLHRLINDLLEYSRAGRREYRLEAVDSQALMDELRQQMHASLEQRSAELTYSNLPQVQADRSHLQRLLQNLVDNGLKFQPAGAQPRVDISTTDLGAQWQFSVRDNGIGIKPEYQQKIFGVFTRLHSEDEYPGTGVGLPICQKIVERHGGRLWLESQPGAGSCFHFTLPKAAAV